MGKTAWFGAGLMGSGFVEALCVRGEEVAVYNRTLAKAQALERFGARAYDDPRLAAQGAERVHIMIADDAAVDALLQSLDGAFAPDAIVIDHSTVAPYLTVERFKRMHERRIAFLHAPVLMSPQAAREAGGVMIVSGDETTFERVRAGLAAMTGDLWYVGDRPEKAAALKLFGNSMLFFVTAGLADGFALSRSAGLEAREAFEVFAHFKLTNALELRGKNMAHGNFTPQFELDMARKDVRLMLETVEAGSGELHVLPAIAAFMDELIAEGHGGDDLAVLGLPAIAAEAT